MRLKPWGILFLAASASASDPEFAWVRTIGTDISVEAHSSAIDSAGNVITTGFFYYSDDFDPGAGTLPITSEGGPDAYVVKLDANGNLIWARTFGDDDYDAGVSVAVDSNDNVVVAGTFQGTVDFDPGAGTFELSMIDPGTFILKLDENGDLIWATALTDSLDFVGYTPRCLTVDHNDFIYAGIGWNVRKMTPGGVSVWTRDMPGTTAVALDVSPANELFVAGNFSGTIDANPGAGVLNLTSAGNTDIYLLRLAIDGGLIDAVSLGGTQGDSVRSFTLDGSGDRYVAGYFRGTVDFDPGNGSATAVSESGNDAFILKLSTDAAFEWVRTFGDQDATTDFAGPADEAADVVVAPNGVVYLLGTTSGVVDYNPGLGVATHPTEYPLDMFLLKLNSNGKYLWSGIASGGWGRALSVTNDGTVFIAANHPGAPIDYDMGPGEASVPAGAVPSALMLLMAEPAEPLPLRIELLLVLLLGAGLVRALWVRRPA